MRRGTGRADRIRKTGRRFQGGVWVLIVSRGPGVEGELITALGRRSGSAVVRSRARRIARECYRSWRTNVGDAGMLLLARSDMSRVPRSRLRADLTRLLERSRESVQLRG